MKVSIVMVTLNAAAVIEDALASIRLQRHASLELVVVDGGSSDATLDIVGRFGDLRPTVLRGPDGGIYDAMNKGLAAATGQALYFLNADDRLAQPDTLDLLARPLQHGPADLVFGDALMLYPEADLWRSHRRVRVARLGYEPLSHQAVLARREAFDRVGPFDTRFRLCADLDWFMRCGAAGLRFQHIPRLVCRCLAGGASQRQYALQMQEVRQIRCLHRSRLQLQVQRLQTALHVRADRLASRWLDRMPSRV